MKFDPSFKTLSSQSIEEMLQNTTEHLQNDLENDITQLERKLIELPGSCKQLADRIPVLPSGYYSIKSSNGTISPVYCDMTTQSCSSGTGGWTRVAYLDMTDPTEECPSVWREITSPIRTCGRSTNGAGCDSVTYPTNGIQYSNVLGRVVGYQFGSVDTFAGRPIDSYYLDGVSITRGMPRDHVWSFAAENRDNIKCPCSTTRTAPSFVGDDYFCESGNAGSTFSNVFYPNDPLWDGQGCGSNPTCCMYNNPPWFCKQLPQATTDDIEIRLCASQEYTSEDTPIELIEIYIQ